MNEDKQVESIPWAANHLGISANLAYQLAERGDLPGAFRLGRRWRVSVPKFFREIHGADEPVLGERRSIRRPSV